MQRIKAGSACSAEAIDGLIRVTDHKQAFPAFGPGMHKFALHSVNILEFIHQQVAKP